MSADGKKWEREKAPWHNPVIAVDDSGPSLERRRKFKRFLDSAFFNIISALLPHILCFFNAIAITMNPCPLTCFSKLTLIRRNNQKEERYSCSEAPHKEERCSCSEAPSEAEADTEKNACRESHVYLSLGMIQNPSKIQKVWGMFQNPRKVLEKVW